jgi:hypothetical protein
MSDTNNAMPGGDVFMKFWTDAMGKMTTVGMTPPAASPDMMDQMRKSFFGVMSQHADEFMRSEQFLETMKQTMDNALAFRQQLNQFLTQNLKSANMATSSDAEHISVLIRGMEERMMSKLDHLSERVERLETNGSAGSDDTKKKTRRTGR